LSAAITDTSGLPIGVFYHLIIGAKGDDTAAGSYFTGNIYEMFCTYNTTSLDAFRTEIAARNGITL